MSRRPAILNDRRTSVSTPTVRAESPLSLRATMPQSVLRNPNALRWYSDGVDLRAARR